MLPHCKRKRRRRRRSRPDSGGPLRRRLVLADKPMPKALDLDAAIAYSRYASAALGARPHERDALVATLDAPFDWGPAEASLGASVAAGEPRALADALRRLRRTVFIHTL